MMIAACLNKVFRDLSDLDSSSLPCSLDDSKGAVPLARSRLAGWLALSLALSAGGGEERNCGTGWYV